MSFVYIGQFYHGKHSIVGYYKNGEEFVYNKSIYFTGNKNIVQYKNLKKMGIVRYKNIDII